ncbi:FAD-dependent pyridine nucleotide-disulfide oxidoreductase [Caldicellulosiruptor owensensis OL]|uniref:FAD-dependent pyridine nucleotide-disulfide oxidoreductase n=1 Tax=Caldicellulosiruptor owensensis (strain ATCC 700167 / DSM 13100 / OL) TaxID=632518 RepID=E4Q431_CALOW|nr:NAD(P)/FAD-dependent oxidoreductase [Caldicellulosiruptor owensensis]ADQ05185.1 FAD-dependent pyridine nucleotide-disulfide oxidoreductase [Caldicellulosiruptor owensensis OL]
MSKVYDVIIVGAGPCGIFTAYELIKSNSFAKVIIFEKGRDIESRECPKRVTNVCISCKPCNITTGFSGAGAFSDGKLSLSPNVGGRIQEFVGQHKAMELIKYVDSIYLENGADSKVYGTNSQVIEEIKRKATVANLMLVESPIRHLGTEEAKKIYKRLQDFLLANNVEIRFRTSVKDLVVEDGKVAGVVAEDGNVYHAKNVVICVGREGATWLSKIIEKYNIPCENNRVDIGVRVETPNHIWKGITEHLYESKFIYYTKTFDDKVRTFCMNPGGYVAVEHYDNLAVVNGHSYKNIKSDNTNFALLVSKHFTDPFKDSIKYGKYIAELANMLSGGKVLVQRYGDFIRGRRSNEERIRRNSVVPTLQDAVAGDLSLVLPYRIMLDIKEMIEALDYVVQGVASFDTLLYGVEVKFYSNEVKVKNNFECLTIQNLYFGGDGAGITRGLMQASVNGVLIAREIANKL